LKSEPPGFQDHFSGHAEAYATYRPDYPEALFDYLAVASPARRRAWDAATGNGQAARGLAPRFARVIASDASAAQIGAAAAQPAVRYLVAKAEQTPLAAGCIDLVTVAQAVHWFDRRSFWREVRRVLVPGGVIAVWSYNLFEVAGAVDEVVRRFYRETVGPYWPPQRSIVEKGYRSLDFPFPDLPAPDFEMEKLWSLSHLLEYVCTWSAVRRFAQARGEDPVDRLREELGSLWGTEEERPVRWRIDLRVGRKPGKGPRASAAPTD
jgi:SAM-dependent methyltransferase